MVDAAHLVGVFGAESEVFENDYPAVFVDDAVCRSVVALPPHVFREIAVRVFRARFGVGDGEQSEVYERDILRVSAAGQSDGSVNVADALGHRAMRGILACIEVGFRDTHGVRDPVGSRQRDFGAYFFARIERHREFASCFIGWKEIGGQMGGQSAVFLRGGIVLVACIYAADIGERHFVPRCVTLVGYEDEFRRRLARVCEIGFVVRRKGDDYVAGYAAEPHIEAVRKIRVEQCVHAFVKAVAREFDAEQPGRDAFYRRPQIVQHFSEHKSFGSDIVCCVFRH